MSRLSLAAVVVAALFVVSLPHLLGSPKASTGALTGLFPVAMHDGAGALPDRTVRETH